MRVALCWELGGNYGHIAGLAPIAAALEAQGAEVVYMLRDLRYAHLLGSNAVCVQAPLPKWVPRERVIHSFADILAGIGYEDIGILQPYADAWATLIKQHAIDRVVAKHAPTALLAAHLNSIVAFSVGSGFTLPPVVDCVFPPLPSAPLADDEVSAKVLVNINLLRQARGLPYWQGAGEIFTSAQQFLCCFPEFDHYVDRPEADYWGPLFSEDLGQSVNWSDAIEPRVFVYLTSKLPEIDSVVQALAQLPGEKLIHIAGGDISRWLSLVDERVRIYCEPLALAQLLDGADLVVGQGGQGLASQAALHGCRQVIIPTQTEQLLLGQRLHAQGLAYLGRSGGDEESYLSLFQQALACPVLAERVGAFKLAYAGFDQREQLAVMAEEIMASE